MRNDDEHLAHRDSPMSLRVLVADDDADVAHLFELWLRDAGYEVTVVGSGQEAFRRISRGRFDLVTLDLNMPGMSGVEVLRSLGTAGVPVRAVIISGAVTREVEAECLAAGAMAVIRKPVTFERLEAVVAEVLLRPLPGSRHERD